MQENQGFIGLQSNLINFKESLSISLDMQQPYLVIKPTASKGRGVFTLETIPEETVIEVAPVIVMTAADRALLDQTLLHDYIFEWGEKGDQCAMALGHVPIYNHSYESNCEYFMDFNDETIMIKTIRPVDKGEELTINYNGDWNNEKQVWFETMR
jgi:SET domain-containing protein